MTLVGCTLGAGGNGWPSFPLLVAIVEGNMTLLLLVIPLAPVAAAATFKADNPSEAIPIACCC